MVMLFVFAVAPLEVRRAEVISGAGWPAARPRLGWFWLPIRNLVFFV